MTDHLEYKVVPSKHWVEGDEEGWSYPELHCTGRHEGRPVRLRAPMMDTHPGTVELAKEKVRGHLDLEQQGATI